MGSEGTTVSNKSESTRVGGGKWMGEKRLLQSHHSHVQLNTGTSVAQRSFSLSYQRGLTLSRQLKHEKFPFL